MIKNVFLTIISGLILLTFCSFAYAKGHPVSQKTAAPKVEPLIYKGVKFVVPNTVKEMGFVQAWDVGTGKKVWSKKVYSVIKLPIFPGEDIFIISLKMEDGKLVVYDERGTKHKIDIPNGILKN